MVIGCEEEAVIATDVKMFLEREETKDMANSAFEDALDVLSEQLYELLPKSLRMLVDEEILQPLVRDKALSAMLGLYLD